MEAVDMCFLRVVGVYKLTDNKRNEYIKKMEITDVSIIIKIIRRNV